MIHTIRSYGLASPLRARIPRAAARCGALVPLLAAFSLGAAVDAGAQTLRLDADAAARRAIEVSHLTAAAAERVSAASSEVTLAEAGRRPTVGAGGSFQQRNSVPELVARFDPSQPPTTIFPDIQRVWEVGVDLTQPLYAGGAIPAGREASRHELDAARADERTTGADVALQARIAYWRAAADLAVVGNAESQQQRADQLLADARSLRQAGMAVDADVLAAEARAAASRVAVINARSAADDSMAVLHSLLEVPAETSIELADAVPQGLPETPRPLADLQEEAHGQRPEVVALDDRLQAAAARETLAGASGRPSVGATLAWNLARPNPRFLPLADVWNNSWSIGVAARWSFWDGGRTDAKVAAAGAQRRAIAEQLAELQRRVDLEIAQARLRLDAALAAVGAADASRQAAAARLDAEEERYRAGVATITNVLDAQAALVDAETEQVTVRTGAWIARAGLDRAVGR